jgi:hypothetical protein
MNAADATRTGHPEYTAGACSFILDGEVQVRRGIIVQCPTVDHEHTQELHLKAEVVEDPEVGLSWVVTAHGANGTHAMEAAYQGAEGLGAILLNPAFGRG